MANRDQEPVMLVLELWAQRPTWPSLHEIVEVIKADMGGARPFARLAPTGQLRRFCQMANAYENALEGRHAVKDYRLPTSEDPMPLSEATTLISDLTRTWLRTKA